tara:strand:- start:50 stop:283 length:234 start_codon:yes stop_codon:yes gene_type:complete
MKDFEKLKNIGFVQIYESETKKLNGYSIYNLKTEFINITVIDNPILGWSLMKNDLPPVLIDLDELIEEVVILMKNTK